MFATLGRSRRLVFWHVQELIDLLVERELSHETAKQSQCGRSRQHLAASLWGVAAGLVVIAAIVLVFLPLTRAWDLEVFLRAGDSILRGLNVYPHLGSPAVYSGFSFVYPYLTAVPFVPLATLPLQASTTLFFVVSVAAVAGACLACSGGDPWRTTLVLGTSSTITGLQLGALSPLLFAGVALLWPLRHRPAAVALLAAPLVCSKLFLAPLLIWLLLARRHRAFVYTSALAGALLIAGFVVGPIGPVPYIHLLSQLEAHEAQIGLSLIGALINGGLPSALAQAIALAVAASVVAASYLRWRKIRDERILFCATVIAALMATPVLWSHYLLIAAAPMLVLNAPRYWFLVVALASWVIHPPHGIHIDPPAGTASLAAWLAVGISLSVFAYAVMPGRGRLVRRTTSPR